ncbi:hypothetical protein [Singulisphaera sp. PoT]|uniref:hypothetical protein n=1 Tax=Singulisphaera sp. PoT TaxID=3411797 RepID=UPI003BF527CB
MHLKPTLHALEAAGLVELWTLARELTWTLRPTTAEALGVEVPEVGDQEDPRWVASGLVPRISRTLRQRGHHVLKHPEMILAKPEVLIEPKTEDPLLLFGRTIAIDPRMRRRGDRLLNQNPQKAKPRRRKPASGNSRNCRTSRVPRRRMVAC